MKNRFNINESEKNRIRGLHGIQLISEQKVGDEARFEDLPPELQTFIMSNNINALWHWELQDGKLGTLFRYVQQRQGLWAPLYISLEDVRTYNKHKNDMLACIERSEYERNIRGKFSFNRYSTNDGGMRDDKELFNQLKDEIHANTPEWDYCYVLAKVQRMKDMSIRDWNDIYRREDTNPNSYKNNKEFLDSLDRNN